MKCRCAWLRHAGQKRTLREQAHPCGTSRPGFGRSGAGRTCTKPAYARRADQGAALGLERAAASVCSRAWCKPNASGPRSHPVCNPQPDREIADTHRPGPCRPQTALKFEFSSLHQAGEFEPSRSLALFGSPRQIILVLHLAAILVNDPCNLAGPQGLAVPCFLVSSR